MSFQFVQAKKISYGPERSLSGVRYIVIHYTGNNNDTAKGNASYFSRHGDGNTRNAGAHFFVDQAGEVYQTIKLRYTAWSVGGFVTKEKGAASYYLKCTNTNSVSIELCDCAKKDPSDKMIKAVKELIAHIRESCPNAKTLVTHWQVSGKHCPGRMTGETEAGAKRWKNFLKALGEYDDKTEVVKKTSPLKAPTETLRYGAKGEQVKRLQRCLNKIDKAGLRVDGSFGPATRKAVKAFQRKHGLEVDGICGPKTRAKIRALL